MHMDFSICAPVKKKIPGDFQIGFISSSLTALLIPPAVWVSYRTNLPAPLHQHLSPGPNLASDPKTSNLETRVIQKSALCGIAPLYLKGIYCLRM